jgi:hypothetical protein
MEGCFIKQMGCGSGWKGWGKGRKAERRRARVWEYRGKEEGKREFEDVERV